ncbi:MAG TPA: hypothetical protein VH186_01140 [Chloroflexia bacterium]|nr:hypothetical protein [Chloroflexia bacterium]
MAKVINPEGNAEQVEAERRLKNLFSKLLNPPEMPEAPVLPPGTSQEMALVYAVLNQRIDALDKQLKAIYKLAFRTSAAVVGMMLPVFGWDSLEKLLKLLGVN